MRFGKMQIMHVLGISVGLTYTLSAIFGVSGEHLHGHANFIATLKLEHHGSETKYISITRTSISNDTWGKLEGTFVLPEKHDQVVFYLEGPAHGVNLLIESLMVTCGTSHMVSIIGLEEDVRLLDMTPWEGKIVPNFGKFFAQATQRTQNLNGIQQDISGRVKRKLAYNVIATT
ncbi:hypothetical protein L1887_02446 [Cichorium endivia]|nr:hypothetical protein L1887_02446 [Cichorium endivia]